MRDWTMWLLIPLAIVCIGLGAVDWYEIIEKFIDRFTNTDNIS